MAIPPNALCTTQACYDISLALNFSMHARWWELDPCEEWDKFVCHGYRTKTILKDGELQSTPFSDLEKNIEHWVNKTMVDTFDNLLIRMSGNLDTSPSDTGLSAEQMEADRRNFQMVKDYYSACDADRKQDTNQDSLNHFLGLVFNGTSQSGLPDAETLREVMVGMFSMDLQALLSVKVGPSLLDKSQTAVIIDPSDSSGNPSFVYDEDFGVFLPCAQAFLQNTCDWLKDDEGMANASATSVWQIEGALFKTLISSVKERGEVQSMTLKQLSNLLPHLPIEDIVKLLAQNVGANVTTVDVVSPGYLAKIDAVVAAFPAESVMAYLYWHVFRKTASHWSAPWKKSYDMFQGRKHGTRYNPQGQRCIHSTMSRFGLIFDSFFLRERFPDDSKNLTMTLAGNLQSAVGHTIEATPWLSNETRVALVAKAKKISVTVGYNKDRFDSADPLAVADYYAGLHFDDGSDFGKYAFAENFFKARKWYLEHKWQKGLQELPMHIAATAATVDAYYKPDINNIFLSAGIFHPSMAGSDLPQVVNYARLGSTLGHEMFHAFDNSSHGQVGDGTSRKLHWTDDEEAHFQERFKRIEDLYENMKFADPLAWILNPSGRRVPDEHLAESHGAQAAYTAWKAADPDSSQSVGIQGFTMLKPEQLFWVLFSSMGCAVRPPWILPVIGSLNKPAPKRFRNGKVVMDTEGWHEAFGCKKKRDICRVYGAE